MAPIKPSKYEFSRDSLLEVRERLGLTQARMAELLGIPANTLSRWEIGATTPDAESLAAIYSVVVERGITVTFFRRRRPILKPSLQRSRLLVIWDFQNLGVSVSDVPSVNSWIRKELANRFAGTSYQRFKAFSHPSQSAAADELQRHGWRVWEDDVDMDDEILNQARSDCGQEPKDTILVLITKDGDFTDLIEGLKQQDVVIFLISPPLEYNQELVQTVSKKNWIKLPISF